VHRARIATTLIVLAAWPASALAQAKPTDASAVYAGLLYVLATLLLFAIGEMLSSPGWNRLGLALWFLVVGAGGCLSMWALPGAALGKAWQLPVLILTLLPFLFVSERALRQLQSS